MVYDITSEGQYTARAVRYPASLDQAIITDAAQLAALETAAEIRAWFAATDHRKLDGDPWSSALGRLQSDVRGLLGIIARQREEIAGLREGIAELRGQLEDQAEPITDVPMVCVNCRKPVTRDISITPAAWAHTNLLDSGPCSLTRPGPVKAMVAAGNESVPRA